MRISKVGIISLAVVIIVLVIIIKVSDINFSENQLLNNGVENTALISEVDRSIPINSSLEKYNLTMNLPSSWDGYSVYEEEPLVGTPMHNLMKALDDQYYVLRIRHPKWSKETPRQDLVFLVCRIEAWNNNASEATNDDIHRLPFIVHFDEEHLLTIDPSNYVNDAEGFQEVLKLLLDIAYIEYEDTDGYKSVVGVSADTQNVMYDPNAKTIRLKWRNITKDEMWTSGPYVLEKSNNEKWDHVSTFRSDDNGANPTNYSIFDGESEWYEYDIKEASEELEDGLYRIGIDFVRKTIYDIELPLGDSPTYRTYSQFNIGEEDIPKDTDADDASVALEGVGIETEFEVYEVGVEDVRAKWYNTLDDEMLFGELFTLERQLDNEWVTVRKSNDEDINFFAIGYPLFAGEERWHTYPVRVYSSHLEKGHYRIHTSFTRETLNGKGFGAGNYPRYQIYSYFDVGDKSIERTLINLHEDNYEHLNQEYGFALYLPIDWDGLSIIKEGQDTKSPMHEFLIKVDKDYSILRIRHPKLGQEIHHDLVFTVISINRWNSKVLDVAGGNLDALPDSVFYNDDYLFAVDPYHYEQIEMTYDELCEMLSGYIEGY